MNNQIHLNGLKRSTISVCVAAALGMAAPGYIYGQESDEETDAAEEEETTITVTGSRIHYQLLPEW